MLKFKIEMLYRKASLCVIPNDAVVDVGVAGEDHSHWTYTLQNWENSL